MRFEDITQEWVDNNKEMLHRYFFDIVLPSYKNKDEKDDIELLICSLNLNPMMPYRIILSTNMNVQIRFSKNDPTMGVYVLYKTSKYGILSIESYFQYTRDVKIDKLVYEI